MADSHDHISSLPNELIAEVCKYLIDDPNSKIPPYHPESLCRSLLQFEKESQSIKVDPRFLPNRRRDICPIRVENPFQAAVFHINKTWQHIANKVRRDMRWTWVVIEIVSWERWTEDGKIKLNDLEVPLAFVHRDEEEIRERFKRPILWLDWSPMNTMRGYPHYYGVLHIRDFENFIRSHGGGCFGKFTQISTTESRSAPVPLEIGDILDRFLDLFSSAPRPRTPITTLVGFGNQMRITLDICPLGHSQPIQFIPKNRELRAILVYNFCQSLGRYPGTRENYARLSDGLKERAMYADQNLTKAASLSSLIELRRLLTTSLASAYDVAEPTRTKPHAEWGNGYWVNDVWVNVDDETKNKTPRELFWRLEERLSTREMTAFYSAVHKTLDLLCTIEDRLGDEESSRMYQSHRDAYAHEFKGALDPIGLPH